ncbi:hypothetical protein CC80DRAFT_190862 [Byssothecium circinans]|uniref:Uncharacterized protein n=1 Tax=Byssothecium circinans TaxID=147558 RepID=A0A6A5THK2_9PLEO|nr:hypothetical protein CC80DRAFT_190862 [Byssothecium circinans]
MPDAINSLSPFLTSSPSIHHAQSPDRNEPFPGKHFPFNERHCDIFILEAPSSGPLYESINVEMMALRRDCKSLLPGVVCRRDRPFGDMNHVALGVDDCDEMIGPNLGSGKCTFMFLVYWTDPEAMARFKHPERESIQKYGSKVRGDWWTKEVVERFARLESAGAWVKQGTFKMMDFEAEFPLIWPGVEILVQDRTGRIEGGGGCRSCCTM